MWKNNLHRKNLTGVYFRYLLRGLNQDRFINALAKQGLTLFKVVKKSNKELYFSISIKENKKFFAIINKLWYNNKKCSLNDGEMVKLAGGYTLFRLKTNGFLSPVYKLFKSVGVLVGGIIFTLTTIFCNDLVFSVDYLGDGVERKPYVEQYLEGVGVGKMSRFSQIELDALADNILATDDGLSFVTCYKRGNRLMVEMYAKSPPPTVMDTTMQRLVSNVDGVVEKVKLYRGTALISAGDSVAKGDILIDGYVTSGEEKLPVNVLGWVSILVRQEVQVVLDGLDMQSQAIAYAQSVNLDLEILDSVVNVAPVENGFLYTITLHSRVVLKAG